MKAGQDFYAVSHAKVFTLLLSQRVLALLVHWVFQGVLYMAPTERLFKLAIDLVLTVLFFAFLTTWLPWYLAAGLGLIMAHTANFLFNGQIYVVLKHFSNVQHTREEVEAYIEGLKERIANEPSICYAAVYGSLARREMKPTSDLDVRLVRWPGAINGVRACWFVLGERSRALRSQFPLDIFVLDDPRWLKKLRADESPIYLGGVKEEREIDESIF